MTDFQISNIRWPDGLVGARQVTLPSGHNITVVPAVEYGLLHEAFDQQGFGNEPTVKAGADRVQPEAQSQSQIEQDTVLMIRPNQ
jgi:hypothetical protein